MRIKRLLLAGALALAPMGATTVANGQAINAEPGSGYLPRVKEIFLRHLGGEVDYNPQWLLVDDSTFAFPASLGVDPTTPVRASDQGAVEARFRFPARAWPRDSPLMAAGRPVSAWAAASEWRRSTLREGGPNGRR